MTQASCTAFKVFIWSVLVCLRRYFVFHPELCCVLQSGFCYRWYQGRKGQ